MDQEQVSETSIQLNLSGRCLLANKLEIPCQSIRISPTQLTLVAAHRPELDEQIIVYLDNIGRLEGTVVDHMVGGFVMTIECTERKREKLLNQIGWAKDNSNFGTPEMRRHERVEPQNTNASIELDDGRRYPITIIDVSLSGAALQTDVRPAIGTWLGFSGMRGQVVRHFAEGIAIEFETISEPGLTR